MALSAGATGYHSLGVAAQGGSSMDEGRPATGTTPRRKDQKPALTARSHPMAAVRDVEPGLSR
jgi:hypothetical protein